jgi:DNA-binding response OmpR family regulator
MRAEVPPPPFARMLLVEDEPNLGAALEIALRRMGMTVARATTLRTARAALRDARPTVELVVLDRALPDGDGLELCRELRAGGFRGAVLMLTAAGQPHDKVLGLDAGADDYLAKPFSWEELAARIRALGRRAPAPAAPTVATEAGLEPPPAPGSGWERDPGQLRIRGPATGWVSLTPLEFKLASHLMEAQGAIVSREELLKDVWGFTLLPKTRTVDHFLGRLRKRFEDDPENPRHFLTVRGAGYRFEA